MYKLIIIAVTAVSMIVAGNAMTAESLDSGKNCSPTNIEYCPKKGGAELLRGKFTTYNVRCSDGTQRTITRWDKDKRWCVGKDADCSGNQMSAAKKACLK
jgi:hypothetical protein